MKVLRVICISLISTVFSAPSFAEAPLFSDDDLLEFEDSGFDLPEFDENFVPVVLTATRIQQHQSDVPASVTILDSEFITNLGTNNLAEVLRYVPGIMMGPDKNNNVDSLNYHGGESALPKNLQVLVDGRSMYRAGLSSVSWYEMPVAIQDIDRIEVVRGPNAASYGANAYQAVINILTKHPSDTYGSVISYEVGETGQNDVFLRQGGRLGDSDYRVSYTQKSDDGFDDSNDSRETQFLNFDSYKHLGGAGELDFTLVLSDSTRYLRDKLRVDSVEIQTNDNMVDETRSEIGVQWTKDFNSRHQLSIQSYLTYFQQKQLVQIENVPNYFLDTNLLNLNTLSPDNAGDLLDAVNTGDLGIIAGFIGGLPVEQQGPASAFVSNYSDPSDIVLVAGDINANLDEFRFDVEIQDTYIYNDSLTFVSGASFRRDVVDSDHYFDGRLFNNTARLFGSVTWKPNHDVNLHLGAMVEEEEFSDSVFSPRAAINYKMSSSQSIRYVYSESVRSPDFFEQFAEWTLTVEQPSTPLPNGSTFYQVGRGPGMLGHQEIISNEIGYYGRLNEYSLELDVRLFHEEESNVLYQTLAVDDFAADTDNWIDHTGVEWQVQSEILSGTLLRMTGAYVEIDGNRVDEGGSKLRIYAKETATLTWMQNWGNKLSSTLNYFVMNDLDETSSDSAHIERFDGRIGQGLSLNDLDAEIYLNFQRELGDTEYLWASHTDITRLVVGVSFNF